MGSFWEVYFEGGPYELCHKNSIYPGKYHVSTFIADTNDPSREPLAQSISNHSLLEEVWRLLDPLLDFLSLFLDVQCELFVILRQVVFIDANVLIKFVSVGVAP